MGNSQIGGAQPLARITSFYGRDAWIEGRAQQQLHTVAGWSGMAQIAAFPDLHPGRHGPVGAAFLADRIYPQLIGPDIGCGMALFALDLPRRKLRLDKAARRMRGIQTGPDAAIANEALKSAELDSVLTADGLGTIGGGNHFCEVQEVIEAAEGAPLRKGTLCLLVHTGSRGHGARVFSGIDETWRDGFMPNSDAAEGYLALHDAAQRWARVNRALVAELAAQALGCDARLICDAPHNHLEQTGAGWLHRKGAAAPDEGLAPLAGSRDSHSYLLSASGALPRALGSVSHGAGRRYDRSSMHGRIHKTRSGIEALQRTRFGGQVICDDRDLLIEEAGTAYKDARAVLRDLEGFGLARSLATLAPLLTFKLAKEGRA